MISVANPAGLWHRQYALVDPCRSPGVVWFWLPRLLVPGAECDVVGSLGIASVVDASRRCQLCPERLLHSLGIGRAQLVLLSETADEPMWPRRHLRQVLLISARSRSRRCAEASPLQDRLAIGMAIVSPPTLGKMMLFMTRAVQVSIALSLRSLGCWG